MDKNMKNESVGKLEKLIGIIASFDMVAVAFSGGVDSTLLMKVCHDVLGEKAVGITVRAAAFSKDETVEAADFCRRFGIRHLNVDIDWEDMEAISLNPPDRCYVCKKIIFGKMIAAAGEIGIDTVADGTNLSDENDYRPGIKALRELGVRSPLQEAGLTKDEIRAYLKEMKLPVWEKPAYACLSSRIPYGEIITQEKLRQIDAVESELRRLGFRQVRVRHHGNVARIEVAPEERVKFFDIGFMDKVNKIVKDARFAYGALDLGGYRTGSMNDALGKLKAGAK